MQLHPNTVANGRSSHSTQPRRLLASLLACLGIAAAAIAQCPPPDPAPPSIPLAELQAGQYNVGMDGVIAFAQPTLRKRWIGDPLQGQTPGGAAGAARVDDYLKRHPVPVVLGPGGQLHLTDNHHRTTAIYTLNLEYGAPFPDYVYYYVMADFSNLSGAAFWDRLLQGGEILNEDCQPAGMTHQYLWPYNRGVQQDPSVSPPPMIPGLQDDVLRSISANARTACGYSNFEDMAAPAVPFVFFYIEFYWANFLRDQYFLQGANWEARGGNPNAQFQYQVEPGETVEHATERLVADAALSCRAPAANTLPGWAPCANDINADGAIDSRDLSAILGGWGTTVAERIEYPLADINLDGFVDGIDLAAVLEHWGPCTAP